MLVVSSLLYLECHIYDTLNLEAWKLLHKIYESLKLLLFVFEALVHFNCPVSEAPRIYRTLNNIYLQNNNYMSC